MRTSIPDDLKLALQSQLDHFLALANQAFDTDYALPDMHYNVRGKIAGKAYLQSWQIRLNPTLLIENKEEFLQQVIPHELAHLITFKEFGKVRPHGKEWQYVMTDVFQRPANTYHSFDITSVQGQTFEYQCNCQTHSLSIRRHNKVMRKQASYHCARCKSILVYTQSV